MGRFRQGRDRHRQAVLKARSVAVAGAVLGVALASTPVYAVVRASRRVGQTLRRSLAAGFSGIRIDARNLLNFSDFADTLADSSSLRESSLGIKSKRIKLKGIKSNLEAESPIIKTLLAVGACLSPKQVWQLHWMGVSQQVQGWLRRWGAANQAENLLVRDRITGVASDLTTRSLVLVRDHATTWPGLSAAQQSQLQTKITLLLAEEQTANQTITATTAETAGAIDGVKALTYSHFLLLPLRFFWVEVLRMISQWQRSYGDKDFARLRSGFVQISDVSMSSQSALNGDCQRQRKTVSLAPPKRINRALPQISVTLKDCVEASAVAIGYVEHPLEIVLKWVDRCLLWLEDRWRSLKQWLTHKPI